MRVLKSGRHRDIDILFSSTTYETGWWVLHRALDFDPGSIDNLVKEFANRNRIPAAAPERLSRPTTLTDAPRFRFAFLLTDYSFTLPQTRGAIAHAAAGARLIC